MIVLAADTSTSFNTVALCRGESLLAETVVDAGRKHSERLLETTEWVLAETGMTLEDVELLAVSIGPGSFTGLRIGAATWKGLALAAERPLAAVPTLDAMTRLGAFHDGLVCPLLDAKMGEVFGALYRFEGGRRTTLAPDSAGAVEKLLESAEELAESTGSGITFLGDGAVLYRERILARIPDAVFAPPAFSAPRASAVALEALDRVREGASTVAADVSPRYLRKSQAEELQAKRSAEAARV